MATCDMEETKYKSLDEASRSFVFFWKADSYFSQFHSAQFSERGINFSCAEQYMMYHKAVCFKDDEAAEKILKSESPMEMKKLGRSVKNYDEDIWEAKCYDVVKRGNKLKFSQNPYLKEKLFETKGKTLVEASPMDRKWGIGLSAKNSLAWNKSTWRGRNLLGYAITEVRDEMMKEEA
ncbi:GTP cyclohydrolase [Plakobranchus ocellatus]|uniref:GTP cyclohydrolase n=1 Tax=Plakobranchus ocellatus TaxID=259542 RepID=A0AAV4A764_9GAST|nr:GTP cyclohydrolase [Plakobranchus ocellatus]